MPDIILSDYDSISNRCGSIRLKFVRNLFGEYLKLQDLQLLQDIYVTWRDTVEVLPLRFAYKEQRIFYAPDINASAEKYVQFLLDHGIVAQQYLDFVYIDGLKYEWHLKKCHKRGNDVYIRSVKDKFKPFLKSKSNVNFFSTVVNDKRKRVRRTKMLYITGTCDSEVTGSISSSWLTFGSYWNSFITNLRGQFGQIDYIRTWQSQKNGYPHFHALVYFHDYEFTAMYWKNDKSWRVHNRQSKDGIPVRDRIKDAWKWGYLDIKCCDDSKKAFTDLLKYVTRDLEGGESDLSNALIWYYGKQSFAISKNFQSLFGVPETSLEPSDDEYINAEGVIQSNNSKSELVMIEVFPVIMHENLPNYAQLNLDNYKKPPDPPPEIVNFLERYAILDCKEVSYRVNADGVKIVVYKRGD